MLYLKWPHKNDISPCPQLPPDPGMLLTLVSVGLLLLAGERSLESNGALIGIQTTQHTTRTRTGDLVSFKR